MDVVGYLNHADLLLEDEHGVVVIGSGHYVLRLGDKVFFKQTIAQEAQQAVNIIFSGTDQSTLHEDQVCVRFVGNRENLKNYLHRTTVH